MKQTLYFGRDGQRLVPADDGAVKALSSLGDGEIVGVRFTNERNSKFHRKYRALVRAVHDATQKWRNPEDLHVELKIRTGMYTEHVTMAGELVLIPDSTAFDKMDETTFAEFYDRVIKLICEEVAPGLDEDRLRAFLEESGA